MLISPDAIKAGWTLRNTVSRDGNDGYVKALQLLRATKKNSEFTDFINKQN